METTDQRRINFTRIALEALKKAKNPRTYALTAESKNALAALAAAVYERRNAQGRSTTDEPTPQQEMTALIEKLAVTGCNLVQQRPTDQKPLPALWKNPLTAESLPPPRTPDERGILAKADPELLELLDELEARPYATTKKLMDGEAHRQALAQIPYGPEQHAVNPFRGTDKTAQNQFFKRDPELAKFYQREATDVTIPLFGKNRNLTAQGKLSRDPNTATLIKVAQRLHEDWRNQDKLAAQEQRAKAEAALKKLETA
jgi:hypothetical protein